MDEQLLKEIAAQLRKPQGDFGNEVAEKMNLSNREMNLNAIQSLDIRPDEIVLEAGMANGHFVKDVLNSASNVHYIGCDYSADMVKLATQKNQNLIENGQVQFFEADLQNLPVEDFSIQKLFTVNTLYFWDDVPATLTEFRRVLNPEGTLSLTFRPKHCIEKYPSTQRGFSYFTRDKVISLMETAGFTIVKVIEEQEPEVDIAGNIFCPEYVVVVGTSKA